MKRLFGGGQAETETETNFPVQHSEEEWQQKLTPAQFAVLRKHGTERAGTSPLNQEKRPGVFVCAGCGQKLFASGTKFESGTGWPSFFAPLEGAVDTTEDRSLFMTRIEVHCSRCGGHLGHVFPDGPRPTGQRYCMNGVAMAFEPPE
ncbi:MAG TPA: peptide-methionine (R)-S-oxide reductase MsrB [Acetobacteraceae bacterium]|jgi:peptide-methionine (R)-S-oxide reductase|nr:peptide-methionine (R)-S-oxide reductase MsrB [Acetobacteraceae bacterium]